MGGKADREIELGMGIGVLVSFGTESFWEEKGRYYEDDKFYILGGLIIGLIVFFCFFNFNMVYIKVNCGIFVNVI